MSARQACLVTVRDAGFEAFVHEVRRVRPSQLLPALAALANQTGDTHFDFQAQQQRDRHDLAAYAYPWRISLVARESILRGNEHRRELNKRELANAIRRIFNAERELGSSDGSRVQSELFRIAHEQFGYQITPYEDIGRTHAMLSAPLSDPAIVGRLKVINGSTWIDLLGASLREAVGATVLHWACAQVQGGRLDLATLARDPRARALFDPWPQSAIAAATNRLVGDVQALRADYAKVHPTEPQFRKYAYNPLTRTPFVVVSTGSTPIAPQPRLILNSVTPASLYHLGRLRYGNDFSTDMGVLFEQYVGANFRLIDGVDVVSERDYRAGRDRLKTVDWIVVLPDLVLLVEVKSRRLAITDLARGGVELDAHVSTLIKEARRQLTRTHDLIGMDAEVVSDLPRDRPIRGLVVTAEPIHLANIPWVREQLDDTPFPVSVASIRDIENLVRLPRDLAANVVDRVLTDEELRTWDFATAMSNLVSDEDWGAANSLVEKGWRDYPWPDETLSSPTPTSELT